MNVCNLHGPIMVDLHIGHPQFLCVKTIYVIYSANMPDTPDIVLHDPNNVSQKLVRGKTERRKSVENPKPKTNARRNSLVHSNTMKEGKGGGGGGQKAGSGGGGGNQSKKSASVKAKKASNKAPGYVSI